MGRVREISGCWEGLWAFLREDKACSGRGAVRGAESAAGSSGPLYLRRRRAFSRLLSVFISCTPLVASPRLSPAKLLGFLLVLERRPWIRKCQHIRASEGKWRQLATKELKIIQIVIHCGIKVR